MDWRPSLVLAVLLVAGCADDPEPRHPTAEELSVAYSPAAEEEPAEPPPSDDDRQSRPASQAAPRQDNVTPARWDGETAGFMGVCLPPGGCVGVIDGGFDAKRMGAGPHVWTVRLTVTWDAVASSTERLEVRIAGANATGTSPLVVEARTRGADEVSARVEGVLEGRVGAVALPRQPYKAVAEFNV